MVRSVLIELKAHRDEDDRPIYGGELSGRAADDGTALRWVHVLSTGPIAKHDSRDVEFRKSHIGSMIEDYRARMKAGKAKAAGNYMHNGQAFGDHDPEMCKGTGYVHDIESRSNGTEAWMLVEWTPEALERIERKEFRYVSAELFYPGAEWSTKDGFDLGDTATFHGFALTNDPAVDNQIGLFGRTPSIGRVQAAPQESPMLILLAAMGLESTATEGDALQIFKALTSDNEVKDGQIVILTTERDTLAATIADQKAEALTAAAEGAWMDALRAYRALPSHKALFLEQYAEKSAEDAARVLSPKGTFKGLFESEGIDGFDTQETGEGMSLEKAETTILSAVTPTDAGGEGLTDKEARIKYPIHYRIYEGVPALGPS